MHKIKANWKAGSEYLPPFTIRESINTLLQADKIFGDGDISYDEAYELIIQFRETYGITNEDIDKAIVDEIKKELLKDHK